MFLDPTSHLLNCVEAITRERERPRVELALASALRELFSASRVRLLKVSTFSGEAFVSLAVEIDAVGARILDDGIGVPQDLTSLERLPALAAAMAQGLPQPLSDGIVLPLRSVEGRTFGFAEIDGALAERSLIEAAGHLQAVFMNILALLDYSEVDTLTGLLNRKTFDDTLLRVLASLTLPDDEQLDAILLPRRRHPTPGDDHSLAVIDIDHFKRVNDGFGHLIGDEVLLLVATMMKSSFRTYDKLFRFGGEEFVVLLKPTSDEDARRAFDRFRAAIEAREFPQVGRVTISIGYSRIALGDQPSIVLDRADEALYWAKENGRNRVASYAALLAAGKLAAKESSSEVELF